MHSQLSHGLFANLSVAFLACSAFWSSASHSADAATSAFAQQVKAALSPADQAWVAREARTALAAAPVSAAAIGKRVSAQFATRRFDAATIEAIIAAVLVEAAKQAELDQQELRDAIEANNRLKAALRDLAEQLNAASCTDDLDLQLALRLQRAVQSAQEAAAQASSIQQKRHQLLQSIIANLRA